MKSLVEDFNDRWTGYWGMKAQKREQQEEHRAHERNPHASNVNRACPREMYLSMTNWRDRLERDPARLARMEHGVEDGRRVAALLRDMGYEVVQDETPIHPIRDRKGRIIYTGRMDFKIVWDGKPRPCEAKCYHPSIHHRIDTWEDFARSQWTTKAREQLLLYMYDGGDELGFFFLYCLGDLRPIEVRLEDHLEEAEGALCLGEVVVDAREQGKPPDFTKDITACRKCWAFGVCCNPPVVEIGAAMLNDPERAAKMARQIEIEPLAKEYEALKRENRKAILATKYEQGLCGDVAFSVKEVHKKEYTVKEHDEFHVKLVGTAVAGAEEKEEGVA